MYCFLRLTLLLSVTIVSVGSPTEKSPAAFFIFGDSVVDVGNNNYIETIPEFKANYAPYGRNSFFNRPTGRFNDGRLMVDFIAEYAKLPLIPPFMQPSAQFTNGANFASGGAGVLPDTSQGLVINFQAQLKQFEEVSGMFIKELGEERARAIIEDAVYFISIGSNDYIIGYLSHEKNREAYTPEEFIGMVIGNFTQSIQELYEKGARKFYILSIADLGCLPAFRAINPKADGGCFKDASALALAHNQALSAVLTSFEYIHKDFKYANINLYDWLNERMQNPHEYGFKDGTNACCGTGPYGGIYTCGGTKNISVYQLCENVGDYVWFDSIHASEKIHEQFAKEIWGEPSSPRAKTLEDLFFDREKIINIGDVESDENELGTFTYIA
ncbi:GDSL esterase/lipase 5-like [Asparagus officinalis]|uniref:GDSL esterase/lipase 5-like n=1 Tax=Asparagus officinalis TaxID=4686 RepID=UPI00098E4DEF|nr:GDSL esterase/lipase 5-like [Asparagus officinalis]